MDLKETKEIPLSEESQRRWDLLKNGQDKDGNFIDSKDLKAFDEALIRLCEAIHRENRNGLDMIIAMELIPQAIQVIRNRKIQNEG